MAISVFAGAALALPVAFARLAPSRFVRGLAFAYVYFFRGTPLLAQVFLVYYGAGQFRLPLEEAGLWWLFHKPFTCALLNFTLNTAAYQAEIYRGAIRSLPRGQWEAAAALGLPRRVTLLRIVAPQAAIVALRPLGNELILMITASAIASVITVIVLMGQTRLAFSRTFDLTIYLYAAMLYLALVELIRRLCDRLEARLTRLLRRELGAGRQAATEV